MGWRYSSYIDGSSLVGVGGNGYFWSSTSGNSADAYALVFDSGGYLNPSSDRPQRYGIPIRYNEWEYQHHDYWC